MKDTYDEYSTYWIDPTLTNEDLHQEILKDLKQWIEETSEKPFFPVIEGGMDSDDPWEISTVEKKSLPQQTSIVSLKEE